jgi:uncharacterized membrane protein YfcA
MYETLIFFGAVVAGAVASVTGFGIGSLLTPVLALTLDTRLAVAAVAIPHAAGTALRFARLREAPDRRVLWSFGLTSAAGGLVGALLHGSAGGPWLTAVFGALLLFTGISELAGWAARVRFRGAAAWLAGALSGLLGGLVGNQGGIRSAALLGFDMRRDVFVATATAIALFVDGARLPLYLWADGDVLVERMTWIAIGTAGVLAGTLAGERLLAGIPERRFRLVVALVIGLLGLAMLGRGIVEGPLARP